MGGMRKDQKDKLNEIHGVSLTSKNSPSTQDPIKKLNSMEDYCKKENIFFNENDRIKFQIKKSKGLYQEFKGSLQRGFKNFRNHHDHPLLEILMKDSKEMENDNDIAAMFPSDKVIS